MTNQEAAEYGLLVMYAWDMCDMDPATVTPKLDPRIGDAGWRVVGYITGSDYILDTQIGLRWRKMTVHPEKRVCYGYLARKADTPDEYVAVIRGTRGGLEWADDIECLMVKASPYPGGVDSGFHSIYQSMTLVPRLGGDGEPLAKAIAKTVGAGAIKVAGHSLGSALATYLTMDLCHQQAAGLDPQRVSGCFFASPRTGNRDFVHAVEAALGDRYVLINYEHDLVPKVPLGVLHDKELEYVPLGRCFTLTDDNSFVSTNPLLPACLACAHHMICYVGRLSFDVYKGSQPAWVQDDTHCAKCVTGSSTPAGRPAVYQIP